MMLYTTLHNPVVLYQLESYRKVQKYNNYFTICSWSTYYDFYGKINEKKTEKYSWTYYLKGKGSIVLVISEVILILLEDGPKRWTSGHLANFEVSEVKKA